MLSHIYICKLKSCHSCVYSCAYMIYVHVYIYIYIHRYIYACVQGCFDLYREAVYARVEYTDCHWLSNTTVHLSACVLTVFSWGDLKVLRFLVSVM